MIGKNEQADDDNTRVGLISEKKKLLQDTSAKVEEEVRLCFEQLAKVLRTREKQLLRQVQAVQNQQLSMLQTSWDFFPSVPRIEVDLSKRRCLEETILQFGELLSSDTNRITVNDAEPYKIEEYVEANRDHISFDKSIKLDAAERSDVFLDSPCESSFNASSDGDVTLENEVTVLLNRDYLSNGPTDSHDSPENFPVETTDTDIDGQKNGENIAKDFPVNTKNTNIDGKKIEDNFAKDFPAETKNPNICGKKIDDNFAKNFPAEKKNPNICGKKIEDNFAKNFPAEKKNPNICGKKIEDNFAKNFPDEKKNPKMCGKKIEENFAEDSLCSGDVADNNCTTECVKTEEIFAMRGDCDVPDAKENSVSEMIDNFTKEDDRVSSTGGDENLRRSADSGSPVEISDKIDDVPRNEKKSRDSEEHPKQIQQWLRQILVETETEPTIHEIEQFAEISKSRFRELQFSLET